MGQMTLLSRVFRARATRAELYGTAGALLVIAAGGISFAAVSPGSSSVAGSTTTTAASTTTSAGTSDSIALAPSSGATSSTTTLPARPSSTVPVSSTTTVADVPVSTPGIPVPIVMTPSFPPPTGPGTADLTFSGAIAGPLVGAVSWCRPRPGAASEIDVNGTLNGTPWMLMLASYDGENGLWEVISGPAGGGTGLMGSGYSDVENYPQTVSGVSQLDWAHGATFDVQLPPGPGVSPAENLDVSGSIDCG